MSLVVLPDWRKCGPRLGSRLTQSLSRERGGILSGHDDQEHDAVGAPSPRA